MTFDLIPAPNAFIIDTSDVDDVEHDRLEVMFENGNSLYFGLQDNGWLGLDRGPYMENMPGGDTYELIKDLAAQFYFDRVKQTRLQRLVDWIHEKINPFFWRPFAGWTLDRLYNELRVELFPGNAYRPTGLYVGRHLHVNYGPRYTTRSEATIPWGPVTAIRGCTITSASLNVWNVL
jgi:hypothetical protein